MAIDIRVDEKLVEEAERLTGLHDRQELIDQALREMIHRRSKLQALMDRAGKVQFHADYDPQKLRFSRNDAA